MPIPFLHRELYSGSYSTTLLSHDEHRLNLRKTNAQAFENALELSTLPIQFAHQGEPSEVSTETGRGTVKALCVFFWLTLTSPVLQESEIGKVTDSWYTALESGSAT